MKDEKILAAIKYHSENSNPWYAVHRDNPSTLVKLVELADNGDVTLEETGNTCVEKVVDIIFGHSFFDGDFIDVTTTNGSYYFLPSYEGKIVYPTFKRN